MQTYSEAKAARDSGMAQVGLNSGAAWQDEAFNALHSYAEDHPEFMIEHAREHAYKRGLEKPHDERAWGPVTLRAIRKNIMERVGFAPSRSGHMHPMPIWKSLIFRGE